MSVKNKGVLSFVVFNYIIAFYMVICWIVNLIQFFSCDFESPYKKEIIKGIGLTGFAFATVWIANKEK